MKKQYYALVIFVLLILVGIFYWYELKPISIKKDCYSMADKEKQNALVVDNGVINNGIVLTKRADYDKIFNDNYKNCLLKNGIEE